MRFNKGEARGTGRARHETRIQGRMLIAIQKIMRRNKQFFLQPIAFTLYKTNIFPSSFRLLFLLLYPSPFTFFSSSLSSPHSFLYSIPFSSSFLLYFFHYFFFLFSPFLLRHFRFPFSSVSFSLPPFQPSLPRPSSYPFTHPECKTTPQSPLRKQYSWM